MSTPTVILDGKGSKSRACVSQIGQLVVGAFAFDETVFNELGIDNAAVNFYKPKADEQFVITGVLAAADLQVSNTDIALITIYEADSAGTATEDKVLIKLGITRLEHIEALPLNIIVNEGKFINAKTDDDDIHMTIMGYYIPKLGD